MARYRGTFLLLLIVALLGGYIYYFEQDTPTTDELQAGERKLLPYREPEDAVFLQVTTPDCSWTVERDNSEADWRLTAPLADAADEAVINRVLAILLEQDDIRNFTLAEGEDIAPYGFGQSGAGVPKSSQRCPPLLLPVPQALGYFAAAAAERCRDVFL